MWLGEEAAQCDTLYTKCNRRWQLTNKCALHGEKLEICVVHVWASSVIMLVFAIYVYPITPFSNECKRRSVCGNGINQQQGGPAAHAKPIKICEMESVCCVSHIAALSDSIYCLIHRVAVLGVCSECGRCFYRFWIIFHLYYKIVRHSLDFRNEIYSPMTPGLALDSTIFCWLVSSVAAKIRFTRFLARAVDYAE